jgi:hypothetical protein
LTSHHKTAAVKRHARRGPGLTGRRVETGRQAGGDVVQLHVAVFRLSTTQCSYGAAADS